MSYFPELHTHSKSRIELELDLSNYATKSDLKNTTGFDTSDFAKKTDLANFKPDFDKLDVDKSKKLLSCLSSLKSRLDKLETTSANLSNLGDVRKTMLLKRLNVINWLKTLMLSRLLILVI